MKVINILFDDQFEKQFQKYREKLTPKQRENLTPKQRENLKQKLEIFKENIFDNSLKTHKLSGNLKDYYSFRINYKDRIRFKVVSQGEVFFYNIGNHDDAY